MNERILRSLRLKADKKRIANYLQQLRQVNSPELAEPETNALMEELNESLTKLVKNYKTKMDLLPK